MTSRQLLLLNHADIVKQKNKHLSEKVSNYHGWTETK